MKGLRTVAIYLITMAIGIVGLHIAGIYAGQFISGISVELWSAAARAIEFIVACVIGGMVGGFIGMYLDTEI